MKVLANTSRCRRQWVAPATIAWRDSLAPCRKNSRPMARLVIQPKATATVPWQGSRLATVTVATNARVKLSGSRRGRAMAIFSGKGLRQEPRPLAGRR